MHISIERSLSKLLYGIFQDQYLKLSRNVEISLVFAPIKILYTSMQVSLKQEFFNITLPREKKLLYQKNHQFLKCLSSVSKPNLFFRGKFYFNIKLILRFLILRIKWIQKNQVSVEDSLIMEHKAVLSFTLPIHYHFQQQKIEVERIQKKLFQYSR